jgi:hypothetical protein
VGVIERQAAARPSAAQEDYMNTIVGGNERQAAARPSAAQAGLMNTIAGGNGERYTSRGEPNFATIPPIPVQGPSAASTPGFTERFLVSIPHVTFCTPIYPWRHLTPGIPSRTHSRQPHMSSQSLSLQAAVITFSPHRSPTSCLWCATHQRSVGGPSAVRFRASPPRPK